MDYFLDGNLLTTYLSSKMSQPSELSPLETNTRSTMVFDLSRGNSAGVGAGELETLMRQLGNCNVTMSLIALPTVGHHSKLLLW